MKFRNEIERFWKKETGDELITKKRACLNITLNETIDFPNLISEFDIDSVELNSLKENFNVD